MGFPLAQPVQQGAGSGLPPFEGRGDDDEWWQLPTQLSSRDAPWWESQLLALAVCPWASYSCDVCVLAYLLQGLKDFIHFPNYS